ncbi:MAG TPA: sulfotransferase [Parvibaculum sp.]|jgi:tetratricopeptide (TPR) repeat protein
MTSARAKAAHADALSAAWEHYRTGQLHLAERIARRAIDREAGDSEAANLLSIVAFRAGDTQTAIDWMARAIAGNPAAASLHGNLCEMYRQAGKLGLALAAGERAVEIDPAYAQGHNNLGIVHFERGAFDLAEGAYRRAIEAAPDYAEAHNNLANALRARRMFDEADAAYLRAIALKRNYGEALANRGAMLRETGRPEEAEAVLRQAIGAKPNYADAYTSLALVLRDLKRADDALNVLARSVAIDPERAEAFILIASILLERGKTEGALSACRRALKCNPDHAGALNLMGRVLRDAEDIEGSIVHCRRALALRPDAPDILNNLGLSLLESGDLDGAAAALGHAAEIEPNGLSTYINLAAARKFNAGDPEIAVLEKAAKRKSLPEGERAALHYALGKVYDDVGDHGRAFEQFAAGAALKRRQLAYDEKPMLRLFDRIAHIFTPKLIAEKSGFGDKTARPVFIVGMPRSGSTLVEQILASHAEVLAAGEVKHLHHGIIGVDQTYGSAMRYPELVHLMEKPQFEAIIRHYQTNMPMLPEGKRLTTDKMLTNYYYVGLIHLLFPNARIIHCTRNAVDTCLSCFSKMFREDMPFTYDLKELAHYYAKYAELMAHWKSVLPEAIILDVAYEDVVSNIEREARRITAHCGLGWDAACLDFHKTERVVKTASVAQVRRPLYATSVQRWRRYGSAVEPLVAELGPLAF